MQTSVRISSMSEDILNLFSIQTKIGCPRPRVWLEGDKRKQGTEKLWRGGLIHYLHNRNVGILFLDISLWIRSSSLQAKIQSWNVILWCLTVKIEGIKDVHPALLFLSFEGNSTKSSLSFTHFQQTGEGPNTHSKGDGYISFFQMCQYRDDKQPVCIPILWLDDLLNTVYVYCRLDSHCRENMNEIEWICKWKYINLIKV